MFGIAAKTVTCQADYNPSLRKCESEAKMRQKPENPRECSLPLN